MRFIQQKVWCHISKRFNDRYTNKAIRRSKPRSVRSFRDLVAQVAQLSFYNPDFTLYFRGQRAEILGKEGTSLFPAIYRVKELKRKKDHLRDRFIRLRDASGMLVAEYKRRRFRGHTKLAKFPELSWAILQHYRVCGTPALDVTNSLRAAASFALQEGPSGIVYALGVPYTSGGISYHVADELVNLRLVSICPPSALWPYFQEASLLASFPTIQELGGLKQMDFGRRLLAKFQVGGASFWDDSFTPMSDNALFPSPDPLVKVASELRERLEAAA